MTEVDDYKREIEEVEQAYVKNRTFEGAMCDFMRIIACNLIEIKYLIKDCEDK